MTEAQFQRFCDFAIERITDDRWLRVDEGIRHLYSAREPKRPHGPPQASLQWLSVDQKPIWQCYKHDAPVRGMVFGHDAIDALEQYVGLNLIGEMDLGFLLK